jgi:ATP-dependent helicase/nuclease subunit B
MVIRPVVLLVPSMAAAVELPRRLVAAGKAMAGLYPLRLLDLARALAEPALLGRGLRAWDTGHDALLAGRLLAEDVASPLRLAPEVPRPPVAAALARTLSALRLAGVPPERLAEIAAAAEVAEDRERLRAVAGLYRLFHESVEGRFADPATLLRAAAERIDQADWLRGAEVLVVDELELAPLEAEFLAAVARRLPTRRLARTAPAGLAEGSFLAWADRVAIAAAAARDTMLAPIAADGVPRGLQRVRSALFEPPAGPREEDGSVELVTAPGEAAEVRAVVRRLLREARRGVPFEEMGVVLPRPHQYARLFTDVLDRLGVPYRLHPSLPLRFGRSARSLLLLFRCRGLARSAVMEFLTFAPIAFEEMLGPEVTPRPAQWDAISREAGIVSGLERWIVGLRSYAEAERSGAQRETQPERAERRQRRAGDAEALLRLVELLSATLDGLAGEGSWPEWAERLRAACEQWIGPCEDREPVARVLDELAGLGGVADRARWAEVEAVLEARFEWERLPVGPLSTGAVHLGAPDAIAGLPFRVVAVPGLVEGGYPGPIRPDPFLLDAERLALRKPRSPAPPRRVGQLSLFEVAEETPPADAPSYTLPTTQDRLLEERRTFHRALSQATERLILSYPRADARTGRERMPSLFFVAAASAREGRTLGLAELEAIVAEDDLGVLPADDTLDRSERDRVRVRAGSEEAVAAIASSSVPFRQSRRAAERRWRRGQLTEYDGLVGELPAELQSRLDPVTSGWPVSASRLATFSRCGFMYLLQCVLHLDPVLEPEERKRLEPLERGSLFHQVAERFLRERRDRGELPLTASAANEARLLELADEALDGLVAGSPPRFTLLWERERRKFRQGMLGWLKREIEDGRSTPLHFEVCFGPALEPAEGEPHRKEPLEIPLGDGRLLRVSGKIDRIDRRADGSLVVRDYKTGRAPRDEGGTYRGGQQLQVPFYVLATTEMFPGHRIAAAFLDYVDGGRRVSFDPAAVTGEAFRALLRGVVDLIRQGVFVQEPAACNWCDYTAVCGPKPLIERRLRVKQGDAVLRRVLELRQVV